MFNALIITTLVMTAGVQPQAQPKAAAPVVAVSMAPVQQLAAIDPAKDDLFRTHGCTRSGDRMVC